MSSLTGLAVSPSGFIFDPRSGQTFTCNRTGLALLSLLRDGVSAEAAAASLADEHEDASLEQVLRDVEDFVSHLGRLHLLEAQ